MPTYARTCSIAAPEPMHVTRARPRCSGVYHRPTSDTDVRWMRKAAALLFVAWCSASTSFAQGVSPAGPHAIRQPAAVEALLSQVRERHDLPAIAAVVVRADEVLAVSAVGVRKQGQPQSVLVTDRFHIGSNGKAITSTVIAKLVEEGVLHWDTRPVDVFPELRAAIHPAYRDVTLSQLLGHRAGLPPYTSHDAIRSLERRVDRAAAPLDQRRVLSVWLLQQAPESQADTHGYSNVGYTVAAAMAETAAGEPWESLIESRVARPLGISLWLGQPARTDTTQPWGHRPKRYLGIASAGQHAPELRDVWEMGPLLAPAGDMSLSPGDYGAFLQQHLSGLKGTDGLLSAASIQHMHFGYEGYALGWGKSMLDGAVAHTHMGSEGTFVAAVMLLPRKDLAAAVLVNSATPTAEEAAREAVKALLRSYLAKGGGGS